MPSSNTEDFLNNIPKEHKFMNLTRMNLSGSKHLREMMDISFIPNLEELDLRGCEKLEKIHKSVGSMKKLEELKLGGCCSLESLPSLVKNECLHFLDLFNCSKLEILPNLPTTMTHIDLDKSGIKEIPLFIGNLINLKYFQASNCKNLVSVSNSIYKLLPYISIYLNNCPSLNQLPEAESSMVSSNRTSTSFYCLDLSGNNFVSLPINTFKFIHIRFLYLKNCEWLVEIPELPRTLCLLRASDCKSLVRFSQFQFEDDFKGDFSNCHKIVENEKQCWREMVERKEDYSCWWEYHIIIPGNEIPEWFSYVFNCHGIYHSFKLPSSLLSDNLIAIACAAIFQDPTSTESFQIKFFVDEFSIDSGYLGSPTESEHMWLGFKYVFDLPKSWEAEEIWCKFVCYNKEIVLKRVGVHFIHKD